MTKKIDFVSIDRGAIMLYANDDSLVGFGNTANYVADVIRRYGGNVPGWKIMSSSLFIEALNGCDDAAQEGGFDTAKEVADLWHEVCEYV